MSDRLKELFKEGIELGRLKSLNDGKNPKLRKLYADKQDAIIKLYNKIKAKGESEG